MFLRSLCSCDIDDKTALSSSNHITENKMLDKSEVASNHLCSVCIKLFCYSLKLSIIGQIEFRKGHHDQKLLIGLPLTFAPF